VPDHPAQTDTPPLDIPLPPGIARLRITERIDPEAADALWAMALAPGWGQRPQRDHTRTDTR
jgi:hypothetical protein